MAAWRDDLKNMSCAALPIKGREMTHERKTSRPLGKSKKALRKEKALRVKTQKELQKRILREN